MPVHQDAFKPGVPQVEALFVTIEFIGLCYVLDIDGRQDFGAVLLVALAVIVLEELLGEIDYQV